jgi:GAF domain-containing protein
MSIDPPDLAAALERVIANSSTTADAAESLVTRLSGLDHYSWVGIYWVEGDDLVLGPWRGPQATEHTRIPIGTGICGAAAASGRTEIVDDVSTDDRYLACFVGTKSEIVVPIVAADGTVLGEIDIDGNEVAAFGPADAELLERAAAALAARVGA